MDRISRHCFNLARYLYDSLKSLKYFSGRPVVQFYHDDGFASRRSQGGIVNFNVMHEDGSFVGYAEVSFKPFLNIRVLFYSFCRKKIFSSLLSDSAYISNKSHYFRYWQIF